MSAQPTTPAKLGPVEPTSPISAAPPSPTQSLKSTTNPDPQPDLVLIFNTALTQQEKQNRVKAQSALAAEYTHLVEAISRAGLSVTGRGGGHNSERVFIFVKASEERVRQESQQEQESDFLYSVANASAGTRDYATKPITPAERTRLVYHIVTSHTTDPALPTCGLALPSKDYPHLTAIFPPHYPGFNKRWLASWTHGPQSVSSVLGAVPAGSLTEVKDHLGEKVALYFAFLRFYFAWLLAPALAGIVAWGVGATYSPVYALGAATWALFFVESWRIKENKLAVHWGTYGVHRVEAVRTGFVPTSWSVDPTTGRKSGEFPASTTIARAAMTVPVLVLFAGGLAGLISCIYAIETIVQEVYDGPGKMYLGLVPTALFAGVVPQIALAWHKVAERLTSWENHQRPTDHAKSVTLKVFAVQSLVAYGPLLLTSYVYIPFGPTLVPWILSLLPTSVHAHTARSRSSFSINSAKLRTQVIALTATGQLIGAFTEIGLPFLLAWGKDEAVKVMERRSSVKALETDEEDEHAFLERIRHEADLPEYTVFADYAEMVTQFGYLALFAVIWPIAPLWSYLNNWFELRGDAFKITQMRRPVPVREASIGAWLDVLSFLAYFSALTTSSLVYLYHPASPCFTETCADKESATGFLKSLLPPTLGGNPSPKSVLYAALLVALTAEHGFLAAQWGVRFVLRQVWWVGSSAEREVRVARLGRKMDAFNAARGQGGGSAQAAVAAVEGEKESIEMDVLEKRGAGVDAARLQADAMKEERETQAEQAAIWTTAEVSHEAFWNRGDKGLEAIQRRAKID